MNVEKSQPRAKWSKQKGLGGSAAVVSEMKTSVILFLLLSISMAACVPSYSRLKSYDTVQVLKDGSILLVLDDRQDEAQTYAEYGFEKRAARLERMDEKHWTMFSEGKAAFGFCSLDIVWNSQFSRAQLGDSTFVMTIERQTRYRGEHQEEIWVMVLRDAEGNIPAHSFPSQQEIGTGLSKASVSIAFSQLDKRLRQTYKQAIHLREQAINP